MLESLNLDFWIIQTGAMIITAFIMPGFSISNPLSAFLTVIAIAFINAQVWDTALFFSIPNTLTIQALIVVFINAFLFWLVVKLMPGISIKGIIAPLLFPIIFTLLSILIYYYQPTIPWSSIYEKSMNFISSTKEDLKTKSSATPAIPSKNE